MLRSYGTLIIVWFAALLCSIVQHRTRKWVAPPAGGGESDVCPSWSPVAFFDLLFFVLLPGMVLVVFFPVLPFSGFRSGVALGLLGFLLGAGPAYVYLRVRKERPLAVTVHDMFFHLCKMLVCFGLLGALYRP